VRLHAPEDGVAAVDFGDDHALEGEQRFGWMLFCSWTIMRPVSVGGL
jgi:hypothetical protein